MKNKDKVMENDASVKMPVLFIGHGSPMNAIEDNEFTRGWREMVKDMPRPKAILVISAHWETRGTKILAVEKPGMIYDMYGFPRELYEVQYPAPGCPELALEIVSRISATEVQPDYDWGFDHGAWSILTHLYPDASIPCFQLSLNTTRDLQWHYNLGKQLAFLRDLGVLIVGSGNIVHNLRYAGQIFEPAPDWAIEFDTKAGKFLEEGNIKALVNYKLLGRSAEISVNSAEHYIPMLYAAALQGKGEKITFFNHEKYNTFMGSWMRCFKIE